MWILSSSKDHSLWREVLQQTSMDMDQKGSILITVTCFIRCSREMRDLSDQSAKLMALLIPSLMSGTFYGPVAHARLIYTRALMSIKGLIIFLTPTKSPGKIDYALITSKCRKNLGGSIMILSLTLTFCQTSMGILWTITRSLNSLIPEGMSGL